MHMMNVWPVKGSYSHEMLVYACLVYFVHALNGVCL